MNQVRVLIGVLDYEFRMQIRRRAVWITFICFALLISSGFRELLFNPRHFSLLTQVLQLTSNVNAIFPICVGVLLADRLPRDRRFKVNELFTSLPGALSIRLAGKYLGSTLATLVPMFAFYSIGVGIVLYQTHDLLAIPLALETFIAIVLPGILFISAFSIACPVILWLPLYQFLFVGYWFWGNLLPPSFGIPTLSATILTPIGGYMAAGFFGGDSFPVTHATALQGVESTLLLLGIASLVMSTLWCYLRWEQYRQ